jgi:hypothetical protein
VQLFRHFGAHSRNALAAVAEPRQP